MEDVDKFVDSIKYDGSSQESQSQSGFESQSLNFQDSQSPIPRIHRSQKIC